MQEGADDGGAMTTQRPTLDTVAKAAGVSRMTVSNAYNRPDQIAAATRAHVLAVAAGLGYAGPDPAARSLRRGRSGTVGVVVTDDLDTAFRDPGSLSLVHGLASQLGEAGQSLLLIPSDRAAQMVRDAVVDGFVLMSLSPGEPAVTEVLARRAPVVTISSPRVRGTPFVTADDIDAAGLLARHLVGLGHRRLAIVTVGAPPRVSSTEVEYDPATLLAGGSETSPLPVLPSRHRAFRDRVRGFLRTARDSGIDDADLPVVVATRNGYDEARAAVSPLLALAASRRPTAVFAVTDVMGLGVLREAHDRGIDVPQRLSVVGFDGIDDAARATPPLTTVFQDLYGQGRAAAAALLDVIEGGSPRPATFRGTLVTGGSTARRP